jgi:hypothetical protein
VVTFQREHASTVSLSDENDGRLTVSISDAVSELETVKFTIQTKVYNDVSFFILIYQEHYTIFISKIEMHIIAYYMHLIISYVFNHVLYL